MKKGVVIIATNLGVANDFNLFVLKDDTQANTDSEGRVAVAGNAVLTNYGVGNTLTRSTTRADLVVGGTLNVEGGENFNGNTVVSSRNNVIRYTMTNGNGVPNQPLEGSPVDFEAAAAYLHCASLSWGELPPNGSAEVAYGGLTLTGTDPGLNIFQIDGTNVAGSQIPLANLNGINIQAPSGSTVLVNVTGESLGFGSYSIFRNGVAATGQDSQHILWNLPEATNLGANTTSIKGSLLAPNATYVAGYGNIDGTLVLDTLIGNVETHNYPFLGTLPDTSCGGPGTDPGSGTGEPGNPGNPGCSHRQAVSDIMESIALQQTALSHILNAEGEKIQKAVAMDTTTPELLRINDSVRRTVDAVARLESVLLEKLKQAGGICP